MSCLENGNKNERIRFKNIKFLFLFLFPITNQMKVNYSMNFGMICNLFLFEKLKNKSKMKSR